MTNQTEAMDTTAGGTLHRVMLFDLQRRQEILINELDHLIDAITYRLPSGKHTNSSSLALLYRIKSAASELHIEATADIRERTAFEEWWRTKILASEDLSPGALRAYQCFRLVWHAKVMIKASVVAERLGELHDRLGQQLERTNPDYPNPVLRRRAEQGQVDKFLCEHVKWVHRDLVLAAKNLGADYPYTEVPATLYSWQYEASSTQHTFVSHKGYKLWKQWALGGPNTMGQPTKFSSLGLSYWMPERLVSHPIIGHELAHQVLQDLYGRDSPYVRLEHQEDQLSRTLRRLNKCAEGWLANRHSTRANTTAQAWPLVREIMCDLLAAERYGCAYLHAWLMEISEIESMADLMHDCFGMLKPIEDFSSISLDYIHREVFTPSRIVAGTHHPEVYYRGKVLVAFLRAHKRETDLLAQELIQQVDHWLECYLDLATGVHAEPEQISELHYGREFEYQFARDLALTVTEEHSRLSPILNKLKIWDSKFIQAAKKHWRCDTADRPQDFSLGRQVMSDPVRRKYLQTIASHRQDAFRRPSEANQVRTVHDALWRIEWAVESHGPGRLTDTQRNELRALNFLAIDDYLYRTGNPYRLLQTIYVHRLSNGEASVREGSALDEQRAAKRIEERTSHSNSIDEARLKDIYFPKWLPKLDRAVRARRPISLEIGEACKFVVTDKDMAALAPLLLKEEEFAKIGLGKSLLNSFHLVSLKPARGNNAKGKLSLKYGSDKPSLLLGRYDAFTLGEMPRDERKTVSDLCAVSRLKRFVRVGDVQIESGRRLAAIMISLRWDASRLMFANWLRARLTEKGRVDHEVYLSDGWEDVVVVVPLKDESTATGEIQDLTALIEELNESPLVAGTETLFEPIVLGHQTALTFRFVCTRGAEGLRPTVQMIHTQLMNVDGWNLENVSGAKDLQIVVKDATKTFAIYEALHDAADKPGGFRVETRVSWKANHESHKAQSA